MNLRGPLRIAPNKDDRKAPLGIPRAFSGHSGRPAAMVSSSRRCFARAATLAIQTGELDSILSSNWNGTWPSWFSIPELYQGTNQFPGRKAHRLCAFRFFSSRDWSSSLIGVKDRINRKFGKSAIRLLGESTEQCRKMRTGNKSTNDYTPGFGSHCLSQNQIFMMKRFLRA